MSDKYYYYLRGVQQKGKILAPKKLYHIIQRAPGKERLFLEENDYSSFIFYLKKMCAEFKFNIYAFCLMPNHLHMIGSSNLKNFSDAMQYLFKTYAIVFNKKYQRKGHVFHGPFRVVPVEDDRYLLVLSTYIHLNPVKANLCATETDWQWSSINLFYNPKLKSFIRPKKILSIIDKDISLASKKYKKLISELRDSKEVIISPESKKAISSYRLSSLKIFTKWFKNSLFKHEQNILSELDKIDNKKYPAFIRKSAKIYVIEQLLARGYDRTFIRELLQISNPSFSHYLEIINNKNEKYPPPQPLTND